MKIYIIYHLRFHVDHRGGDYKRTWRLRKDFICGLLKPKFSIKKSGQVLKALTMKLSIFKNKRTSPPRDFDKSLQIVVTCTATERHRMKKLKFHRP